MKIVNGLFTWFIGISTFFRGILGLLSSTNSTPSTHSFFGTEVKLVKTTSFSQKMQNSSPVVSEFEKSLILVQTTNSKECVTQKQSSSIHDYSSCDITGCVASPVCTITVRLDLMLSAIANPSWKFADYLV